MESPSCIHSKCDGSTFSLERGQAWNLNANQHLQSVSLAQKWSVGLGVQRSPAFDLSMQSKSQGIVGRDWITILSIASKNKQDLNLSIISATKCLLQNKHKIKGIGRGN